MTTGKLILVGIGMRRHQNTFINAEKMEEPASKVEPEALREQERLGII